MLKLGLYCHVWWISPPGLLTDYAKHIFSISQCSQYCNCKIRMWTDMILIFRCQYCIQTQIFSVVEKGLSGDFYYSGSLECV